MPYLTSLRGIAALIVVFFHIKHYFTSYVFGISWVINNGYLAVDFFFVLSGFILAYTYHKNFKLLSTSEYFHFLVKRLARIYPLHLTMLIVFSVIPILLVLTGRDVDQNRFGLNALIAKLLLIDVWGMGDEFSWNVPSWSISAEFAAYLMFPLIMFVGIRLSVRDAVVALGLLTLSIMLIFHQFGIESIGAGTSRLGIFRCVLEFSMGVTIFCIKQRLQNLHGTPSRLINYMALITFIVCAYLDLYNYLYVPLVFSSIILGMTGYYGVVHRFLETQWLILLGEISYSIYLTHYFIRDFLTMWLLKNDEVASWAWIVLYILTTILFSLLTYKIVEVPSRAFLTKLLLRPRSVISSTE